MSNVICTATGIKVGNKGLILKTREQVADAIAPLPKGERRRIRKHLFRKGRRNLATAGIEN
jgi:hypothetical protein